MSYQVLARKWRPKKFEEVVGQEHVLRALTNALTQKRLHHAYLFSGTRGVGKTTIARILAKCFNCETDITAVPCNKCPACLDIDAGNFIDLIEVDAASRTKVEDTRDLLENAQYLPAGGRFKVYIIDEVHMLSGHSFNALLKTLEEPPEHVKFLLATTDPQKLPVTVLSRCLQFNLKALSPDVIKKQLQYVLDQEKISSEPEALQQIAIAANGSVRDALSLLDQAIAYGQNQVQLADVNSMLGTIDTNKIFTLLEALATNNAHLLLDTAAELAEFTVDFTDVLNGMLEALQRISIIQMIPDVDSSAFLQRELTHKLATQIAPEDVQLYYQVALMGKRDLPYAPTSRVGFEMTLLRMLGFSLETKNATPKQAAVTTQEKPVASKKMATTTDIPDLGMLRNLNVTGPTKALLEHCVIAKIDENSVELLLEPNQSPLLNKNSEARINKAFSEHFGRQVTTSIKFGTSQMNTLAKIDKEISAQKNAQNLLALEKDNKFQELINTFDAKIIPSSITNKNK